MLKWPPKWPISGKLVGKLRSKEVRLIDPLALPRLLHEVSGSELLTKARGLCGEARFQCFSQTVCKVGEFSWGSFHKTCI